MDNQVRVRVRLLQQIKPVTPLIADEVRLDETRYRLLPVLDQTGRQAILGPDEDRVSGEGCDERRSEATTS